MSDDFDRLLAEALAPEPGTDRRFVSAVTRRIAAEEVFARSRRALLRDLARELAAVAVLATALVVLAGVMGGSAPEALLLAGAIMLFGLWLAVTLSGARSGEDRLASALSPDRFARRS
jgi:hypothetical protein